MSESRTGFLGNWRLLAGGAMVLVVLAMAATSIFFTPYPVNGMDVLARSLPPSLSHLAGTDTLGRDIFSRLMAGARFTLFTAFVTVLVSSAAGTLAGLLSGYIGGLFDEAVMRLTDALSSFPGILIALVVVTVLDYGKYTVLPALCIMFTPSYVRIARMGTVQVKSREFIQSYIVYGVSRPRLLFVHILPNLVPMILPSVVVGFSNAILAEAGMSFLGLGIQPPDPSWGWMLSEAQNSVLRTPWFALSTGAIIMFTITAFNMAGDGIRKALSEDC